MKEIIPGISDRDHRMLQLPNGLIIGRIVRCSEEIDVIGAIETNPEATLAYTQSNGVLVIEGKQPARDYDSSYWMQVIDRTNDARGFHRDAGAMTVLTKPSSWYRRPTAVTHGEYVRNATQHVRARIARLLREYCGVHRQYMDIVVQQTAPEEEDTIGDSGERLVSTISAATSLLQCDACSSRALRVVSRVRSDIAHLLGTRGEVYQHDWGWSQSTVVLPSEHFMHAGDPIPHARRWIPAWLEGSLHAADYRGTPPGYQGWKRRSRALMY